MIENREIVPLYSSEIIKICVRELATKISEDFNNSDNNILFIHIREPEEIGRAVTAFGAKTLLMHREGHKDITSNYSDANVYNYTYDYVINNDGTLEELIEKAKKFAEQLRKEK